MDAGFHAVIALAILDPVRHVLGGQSETNVRNAGAVPLTIIDQRSARQNAAVVLIIIADNGPPTRRAWHSPSHTI
jgi:hypothetical protein